MLVPMTTVRPGSTPPQPISLVAQPLPVQNGVQPGSKVGVATQELLKFSIFKGN